MFRQRFGDAGAIRGLFDHVLERSAPRNVTLQVVPLEGGLQACLDGPVRILETPAGQRLGYSEGAEERAADLRSEGGECALSAL